MTNYKDQYRHPMWQKKRLEILQRDKFTCVQCGETEVELHVHHAWYAKDCNIWEYPDRMLQTLCSNCHQEWHERKDERNIEYNMIICELARFSVEYCNVIHGIISSIKNPENYLLLLQLEKAVKKEKNQKKLADLIYDKFNCIFKSKRKKS